MIVILGASGYIGSAFAAELNRRHFKFESPPRKWLNYCRYDVLHHYLSTLRPDFLINCAGYTGKPNVDECEQHKVETLVGNVLLPQTISHVCQSLKIPWAQISSGCIYNGAGPYSEADAPNFTFREKSSVYAASKAMAEEIIRQDGGQVYVWRLRIPFDEFDGPRNYLSKLQRYPKVYEATNSLSHRGDFVKACLDLWEARSPFGIYNVTNPGSISTKEIVAMIQAKLSDRPFFFFKDDTEFYSTAAVAPRSNCTLDVSKLLASGVRMRTIHEAVENSLKNWRKE